MQHRRGLPHHVLIWTVQAPVGRAGQFRIQPCELCTNHGQTLFERGQIGVGERRIKCRYNLTGPDAVTGSNMQFTQNAVLQRIDYDIRH